MMKILKTESQKYKNDKN